MISNLRQGVLVKIIQEACAGLSDVSPEPILAETRRNLYDGISQDELTERVLAVAHALEDAA